MAVLLISGCSTLVTDLTVYNAKPLGGTGRRYVIARNLGAAGEQAAYLDKAESFAPPIPARLRGGTLIRVADGDKGVGAGSADFLSFVVRRSSWVYVAHDAARSARPGWLSSSFFDTGEAVLIGSSRLELFGRPYPSHASVVLGGNLPGGVDGSKDMYSVIVVPTAEHLEAPTAPRALQIDCATAAVVGLRWTASSDEGRVAGYRIERDGAIIGTTSHSYFSDTSVAASTRYTYVVAAFDRAGNAADSAPRTITTEAASMNGDAPVCPSRIIPSMTWNWAGGYTQPNGSDLWPVTWGMDGNIYALFGDGGGFGGDDHRGRASFGIAMMSGAPPPTDASARNIYGGYRSEHAASIGGKASSIIAVGPDFYAIAGIFRPSDSKVDYPSQPSSSPNHVEIAYSLGDAFSWRSGSWVFCGADSSGNRDLSGAFCPIGFVNFGAGNAGAPDGYVYLYGNEPAARWETGPKTTPVRTYLARVPADQILIQAAYRFFAGQDPEGNPIWSDEPDRMMPVFTDRNANRVGCEGICDMGSTLEEAFYNPALRRYIGVAQGDYVAQTSVYEAPDPWGPWTVVSYNNIDAATGQGGWANLGIAGSSSIGIHAVNAWTSPSGQRMWMTYSGGGKAPPGALFPPAGTSLDSFNLVSVELKVAGTP
jgi:hypothetical protein